MTGDSLAVPAFGTVFSVETLSALIALGTTELASLNLLFQLDNLRRFLAGEKAFKESTGDPWYDTKKAWIEILIENVTMMALQNPRTYGGYYSRYDTPLLGTSGED